MSYNLLTLSAEILEMDEASLQASLREGQTLLEIADSGGYTEEEFLAALLSAAEEAIEAAITAGTLTEDESVQQLDQLEERLAQQIEGVMKPADGQGTGKGRVQGQGNGQSQNGQAGAGGTAAGAGSKNEQTTTKTESASAKPALVDISGHWAEKNIQSLFDKGILTGDTIQKFNPNGSVTREQIAVMVTKGFGLEAKDESAAQFSDVPSSRWSYSYVEAAQNYFTMNGAFEPTKAAVRSDVVVTLIKAYLDASGEVSLATDEETEEVLTSKFKDAASIVEAARPYVAAAVRLGVVNGDSAGKFNPSKSVTRAEIASMLNTILTLVDDSE